MTGKKTQGQALQLESCLSYLFKFQVNRGLLSFRIHYLSKLADFAITLTQLA